MGWSKHADSLSWSRGHTGKGYLLHSGEIKTWNVDPYNPLDHSQLHQQNGELSPIALNFEIDPDGGIVTEQPTKKVETIIQADPRLYDAGQREVFEDAFDLDHFKPSKDPEGKPNYNFIMSGEALLPINMTRGCPRCHGRNVDGETGTCNDCGYVIPYDGWEQMQGNDENGPVPGHQALGWGTGAMDDTDFPRAALGDPHYGAIWEWPNAAPRVHRNLWTGEQCNCGWGPLSPARTSGRISGVELRRILKAPDKAWRTPEGEAFREMLKDLPDAYDSLLPFLAQRFKKGDIRIGPPRQHPGNYNPQTRERDLITREPVLEYLPSATTSEEPPHAPNWDTSWRTLPGRLPSWHQWYEARQHPLRRGVNVMDPAFTVKHIDELTNEHQRVLMEQRERQNWLERYGSPMPMHRFGPEAGKYKGWQVVPLDQDQAEGDSEALGHCIGNPEHPYWSNIGSGEIAAYSLRDAEGYPHVSWHINPRGDTIGHMQGQSGYPNSDYRQLITQFNQAHDLTDEEGPEEQLYDPNAYDDYFTFPQAQDVEDYNRWHGEAPDYDYAYENGNIGEGTEFDWQTPDWADIAQDYLNHYDGYGDKEVFHQNLMTNGHESDMAAALQEALDPQDPDHIAAAHNWNAQLGNHRNTLEVPAPAANQVDDYNDAIEEGLEPEPNDWERLARDYLDFPHVYASDGNTYDYVTADKPNAYQRFHDSLSYQHHQNLGEALAANIDWENPNHVQAIGHWNRYAPQLGINPPPPPPEPLPEQIPGQTQWQWPSRWHDQGGEGSDWNRPVDTYGTALPWGWGATSSFHHGVWHLADGPYGYTNWDTSSVILAMDNDRALREQSRDIVRRGGTPEQLRDWAIKKIIGPYNKENIEDAQEWNDFPEEERLDYNYESFKDKHGDDPRAMDLYHGLVGGPNVDDEEPNLIDPELVNWQEVLDEIKGEFEEQDMHDRSTQEVQDAGLTFQYGLGHELELSQMYDAWLKHHGAQAPEDERTHTTFIPQDQLLRNDWDDDYWQKHIEPNSGWHQPTRQLATDALVKIRNGTASPEQASTMQAALAGQGYPPDQITQIMQQRWRWDPDAIDAQGRRGVMVDLLAQPQQVDPSLDQPGDLYPPEGFRAGASKTAATPQWCPRCEGKGHIPNEPYQFPGPTLNMSTGELGPPTWMENGSVTCPRCKGMKILGVGHDILPGNDRWRPYNYQVSDEDLNPWGGLAQDYTHRPQDLPPLGPRHEGSADPMTRVSPAQELQEWLADIGGAEEPPSIHHESEQDMVASPPVSPANDLAYYPPDHVPSELKQSAEKLSMPADPSWWRDYEAYNPLYHGTTVDRLPTIMSQGLIPWDDPRNPGGQYGNDFEVDPEEEWFRARPGHTYLTPNFDRAAQHSTGPRLVPNEWSAMLAIDPGHLDPQHVNPDEDAMGAEGFASSQQDGYGGRYESMGQAAEAQGWGDDPEDTKNAIQNHEGVAYRGTIPPEAIHPMVFRDGQWVDWDGSQTKQSAMTPNQRQRVMGELEPDTSEEIYRYPDDWTIRRLSSWEEVAREGDMMHHCWYDPDARQADDGIDADNPEPPGSYGGQYMSLRDQSGWPHASFHYNPEAPFAYDVYGHGDSPLKPEHAQRLLDWWNQAHPGAGRIDLVPSEYYQPWMDAEDEMDDMSILDRLHHGATAKTADAAINQADATNDALGKPPAMIPSRMGDPDYLEEVPCQHCHQKHRPDEPCPDSSVSQFKAEERSWYNRDPNSFHSEPDGHSQVDLSKTAALDSASSSVEKVAALRAKYGEQLTQPGHQLWFKRGEWGRGFVHDPTQTVHTWPEAEGTHNQMAFAKHFDPQDCARFYLKPDGTIVDLAGPSSMFQTITQADPALARANGMPEEKTAATSTEDSFDEMHDKLYSDWSITHDYDPRWDYSEELRPHWQQHPLVQAAQTRLNQYAPSGRVFAADLESKGAVGIYAFGTGVEEPAILVDPYQHERHTQTPDEAHEQMMHTVDHEYRHAQQADMAEGEPDWDEDDAEEWRHKSSVDKVVEDEWEEDPMAEVHDAITKLAKTVEQQSALQPEPKRPRKLVIKRDEQGRMESIEEA